MQSSIRTHIENKYIHNPYHMQCSWVFTLYKVQYKTSPYLLYITDQWQLCYTYILTH